MRTHAWLPLLALLAVPRSAEAQPFAFVTAGAEDALGVLDLAGGSLVGTLPLAGLPSGAALSPDGTRLFVARSEADSLAVVDVATGAVSSIAVGDGPSGVAVVPRGRRVYVANTSDDTLSAIDTQSGAVVATIPVGSGPLDVVAGGTRVFVANCNAGTVSVVDWTTNSVVATLPVGRFPMALAMHQPSGRLYVANFFDDTVSVIDLGSLAVVATVSVDRGPRGLALDPMAGRLYVASFEDASIQVVATSTNTVVQEAATGGRNPLDLLLSPDRSRLYVAHFDVGQSLKVLDAATLQPLSSVAAPAGALALAGWSAQAPPFAAFGGPSKLGVSRLFARPRAVATRARPDGSDVVIVDDTFLPAHWQIDVTGEEMTTQELTGGNPGAWRRTTHFGAARTDHRLIRPGSQYDPGQGAVVSLDYSWDRRILAETLVSEGLLVEQNGVFYRSEESTFFAPTWQTHSRTELTAADFDDGQGGHPDFGPSGSLLHFGYFRQTAFNQTVPHGIDNFEVTLHLVATNPAGRLGFEKTFDTAEELNSPFVYVQRIGSGQGAVTVDVHIEEPNGSTSQETLSWGDGDTSPRSVLLALLDLPPGSGARTARLRLQNPTGGATIEAARGTMAIVVFPEAWPDVLRQLFLRLDLLLGAFSPGWLLVLAGLALMAHRARGAQRHA